MTKKQKNILTNKHIVVDILIVFTIILLGSSAFAFYQHKINIKNDTTNNEPALSDSVMDDAELTNDESTKSASITEIPSTTPKPVITKQPPPTPTLEVSMDLNLEKVAFFPENVLEAVMSSPDKLSEDGVLELFKSGEWEPKFKQSNKLDYINIEMRNNGHEDAIKTVINIIVDGKSIYQKTIDVIEKQTIKYEKINLDFPSQFGKHKMEVQLNGGKLFPESRFDNNSKTYEYEYLD